MKVRRLNCRRMKGEIKWLEGFKVGLKGLEIRQECLKYYRKGFR